MKKQSVFPKITVGLDLGDRKSAVCEIDESGEVVKRAVIGTNRKFVKEYFGGREPCRVVMEAGTHSPWLSRDVKALGHEAVVANPALIYKKGRRKNDPKDAEYLGRQGRADTKLLYPIEHRSQAAQEHLAMIRARDQLVGIRSKLISHVRGAVKTSGERIERCSSETFSRRARGEMPAAIAGALLPLLETIESLTAQIRTYDARVEELAKTIYPDARWLMQIKGVGALTALGFMLLVDDPKRFLSSRDVGPYFGLVPKLSDSGDANPQLRISKAGDGLGRRLLVTAAHYILGPFGPECDLRRFGEAIARRGGKNAKKRAVVAVARKLAVLMHHLWVSRATYDPDWTLKRAEQRTLEASTSLS